LFWFCCDYWGEEGVSIVVFGLFVCFLFHLCVYLSFQVRDFGLVHSLVSLTPSFDKKLWLVRTSWPHVVHSALLLYGLHPQNPDNMC